MATKSGALAITTTLSQIALCGAGAEIVIFGLVFVNTTGSPRTVTLRVFRSADGVPVDIPFIIPASSDKTWGKPIALQPGDYVSVLADTPGVSLVWSLDEDTGSNPISVGLTPRGAYSASATYAVNDVVSLDGSSYVCISAGSGVSPPNTSRWMLLASVGPVGGVSSVAGLTGAVTAAQLQSAAQLASTRFAVGMAAAL